MTIIHPLPDIPSKMGCIIAKEITVPREEQSDLIPWSHVHTSTLEAWSKGDAQSMGFNPCVDYVTRKGLQPWCTEGRHIECLLPAPMDESELDVKYIYDEMLVRDCTTWRSTRIRLNVCYKNLIKKSSQSIEPVRMIAYRDDYIVAQVIRTDKIFDFLIIHLSKSKVIGCFQESYADHPFLWECYISPDATTMLLKPNLMYALKFKVESAEDVLKVIKYDRRQGAFRCTQILFADQAMELILCFDPRYRHSRVAIGNLTKRDRHVLCIYHLQNRKMLSKACAPQYQRIQNISFTPGGDLLACLIVSYVIGASMSPTSFSCLTVLIYYSDNLSLTHKIPSFGTNSLHSLTPAAVFPVFSSNGDYLAMGSGNGGSISRVEVYQVPPVMRLKSLCRRFITTYLNAREIQSLPASSKLIEYLLFRPNED